MTLWQGESKRKNTGGRKVRARKKRRFELGSDFLPTIVGDSSIRRGCKGRGSGKKSRLSAAGFANVLNPKTKECKRVKILSVRDNPSDKHFVQRNIVTKGATVQTEIGLARITSRPGQDGVVNAVLIEGGKE